MMIVMKKRMMKKMIELLYFALLMLGLQAIIIPMYDYLILDVIYPRLYSYIPSMDMDTLIRLFQEELKK